MKALLALGVIAALVIATLAFTGQPLLVTNTRTLGPSADAFVNSQNIGTNYGSDAELSVHQFGSPPNNGFLKRTLLRFDYGLLGQVETIERATLRLITKSCVMDTSNGKNPDIEVWQITGGPGSSWSESTVAWNTEPIFSGASVMSRAVIDLTPNVCPTVGSSLTADLTAAVAAQISGSNLGFELTWDDESTLADVSDEMRVTWSSREGGSPELEIQYTSPGDEPPPGVGPGTNRTRNDTGTDAVGPDLGIAALIFVIVFILIAILARRRPGLAIVLGTVAGAIAAVGYLLLGGA